MRQLTRSFTTVYGHSNCLYGLFPCGPAKQACRVRGRPKPKGCI